MKIIKYILKFWIDFFLNRFQYYIVAFLIYTFIANIETIFPKLTFWNFLWVILAAEVIRIILNHSKDKNKNLDTTSN